MHSIAMLSLPGRYAWDDAGSAGSDSNGECDYPEDESGGSDEEREWAY